MTDDETQRFETAESADLGRTFPLRTDDAFRERLGWLVLALCTFIVLAIGFLLAALVLWAFRRAMGEV